MVELVDRDAGVELQGAEQVKLGRPNHVGSSGGRSHADAGGHGVGPEPVIARRLVDQGDGSGNHQACIGQGQYHGCGHGALPCGIDAFERRDGSAARCALKQ